MTFPWTRRTRGGTPPGGERVSGDTHSSGWSIGYRADVHGYEPVSGAIIAIWPDPRGESENYDYFAVAMDDGKLAWVMSDKLSPPSDDDEWSKVTEGELPKASPRAVGELRARHANELVETMGPLRALNSRVLPTER